jgi:hypothetical protein
MLFQSAATIDAAIQESEKLKNQKSKSIKK